MKTTTYYDIVSHHFLRRRARKRLADIRAAQVRLRKSLASARDRADLDALGVGSDTSLRVVKAQRGPWRWYVVRD